MPRADAALWGIDISAADDIHRPFVRARPISGDKRFIAMRHIICWSAVVFSLVGKTLTVDQLRGSLLLLSRKQLLLCLFVHPSALKRKIASELLVWSNDTFRSILASAFVNLLIHPCGWSYYGALSCCFHNFLTSQPVITAGCTWKDRHFSSLFLAVANKEILLTSAARYRTRVKFLWTDLCWYLNVFCS